MRNRDGKGNGEANSCRKARVLFLEEIHEDIERESPEPFEAEVDSDGLAYVMYTSGSKGRPRVFASRTEPSPG